MRRCGPFGRINCVAGPQSSREMRLGGAPGGPSRREGGVSERTAPWAVERMSRMGSLGCLIEEFELMRWSGGGGLGCHFRYTHTCYATPVDSSWRMTGTIQGPFSII
jgi:hypothetical protein